MHSNYRKGLFYYNEKMHFFIIDKLIFLAFEVHMNITEIILLYCPEFFFLPFIWVGDTLSFEQSGDRK